MDNNEKDAEITELRDECAELHNRVATLLSQIRIRDERIDEIKSKLESVQASAYADSVDAGMRERRLKDRSLDVKDAAHVLKAFKFYLCQLTHCAYDERTAQWIIDNWEQDYKRIEADDGNDKV